MAQFDLMNKNHYVLSFAYDSTLHAATAVISLEEIAWAPPAILSNDGTTKPGGSQHLVAPSRNPGLAPPNRTPAAFAQP